MDSLGKRLKYARERKGLSQVEVNNRTGINNKTLSRYEKDGTEPDADALKKLSELYEVTVDWIVGKESNIINDQAKNAVWEAYSRLPHDKKKVIDDMIKALDEQKRQ